MKKYGFREDFYYDNRFHLTDFIGEYYVSTADLGIDHSLGLGDKPLFYETMIFKKNGEKIDFVDLYCERYSTQEEAEKGHKEAIQYVKDNFIKEEN